MTGSLGDCSVVIAAHDVGRLPLLERAACSALAQGPGVDVVVAVDHDRTLLDLARDRLRGVRVVLNDGEPGASATRNAGARAAVGRYLAFLDDDAEAEAGWLAALVARLRTDDSVVGVGGWVEPGWTRRRPSWFPAEFDWVVGASYRGQSAGEIRNAWAENMAVRTAEFWAVGGFREGFGKLASTSRPEDTELCLRLAAAHQGRWWFEPAARVRHHVPAERSTVGFFVRRCRAEGVGKAELVDLTGPDGLASERDYTRRTLPAGVAAGLLDPFRGRPAGVLRAGVIILGLAAASLGYAGRRLLPPVPRSALGASPSARTAPTAGSVGPAGPARVVTIDLAEPLAPMAAARPGEPSDVLALVTLCGRPIGMVPLPAPTSPDEVAAQVERELGPRVRTEAGRHGLAVGALTASGLPHDACRVREQRSALASTGPGITVVLCTRNRPTEARRCLESLAALDYRHRQLLVVDNAPDDTATADAVRALPFDVDYVVEPRPGLAAARNRALAEARYDLIAFVDDDERVDPHWLTALAEEFADPQVAAVTGLVLPGELATPAQARFERIGGHSKGRGFTRVVADRAYQREIQSPLFPRPTFGAGANMAFRRCALAEIGGFDTALGAGTRTGGAEDTLAFTEVMLAGRTLVYAPAALTWHYHRRDDAALTEQLDGYARGLGAFYAALVLRSPRRLGGLVRLTWALARRRTPAPPAPQAATLPGDPRIGSVTRLRLLVLGALLYLRSRAGAAR